MGKSTVVIWEQQTLWLISFGFTVIDRSRDQQSPRLDEGLADGCLAFIAIGPMFRLHRYLSSKPFRTVTVAGTVSHRPHRVLGISLASLHSDELGTSVSLLGEG